EAHITTPFRKAFVQLLRHPHELAVVLTTSHPEGNGEPDLGRLVRWDGHKLRSSRIGGPDEDFRVIDFSDDGSRLLRETHEALELWSYPRLRRIARMARKDASSVRATHRNRDGRFALVRQG